MARGMGADERAGAAAYRGAGQVDDGTMSVRGRGGMLGLSGRQMFRLLKRYRTDGAAAIRHKARGRARTTASMPPGATTRWRWSVRAIRTSVHAGSRDAGGTPRPDGVARDPAQVDVADGLWLPKAQRRSFHQPRLRRERYEELVQIDGSDHRWFEDRAEPCTLLVFVDDATSRLMQMRFVPSESTFAYFEALELYLQAHGRPVAFYATSTPSSGRRSRARRAATA